MGFITVVRRSLFILLIGFPLALFCQDGKVFVGIEGGSGVSFFRNYLYPSGSERPAINYNGGVFATFYLNKTLSIKTIVSIHEKGFDEYGTSDTKRFMFLDIPVLLKINILPKGYFSFITGTYFTYLLGANSYDTFSTGKEVTNIYSDFRHFDLGLVLGFGTMIPLYHNLFLSIEVRDEYGLFNLQESYPQQNLHGDVYYYATPYYTNSLFLDAGLAYRFGHKK
jgi:hypothetical protein